MPENKQTAVEEEYDLDQFVESTLPTQLRRQERLQKDRRKFEEGLTTLGNSQKKMGGVINSIIARPRPDLAHSDPKKSVYEIACGWRRWRAAKHVGLKKIRCKVLELTDTEILEWQHDENHGREGSSPLDDAYFYRHLVKVEHYTVEQLADRFNKTKQEVEDLLALNDLCPEAAQDFEDKLLPKKHAVYLAKEFSPEVQAEICKEALAFHYNNRQYGAVSFTVFEQEVHENFKRVISKAPFDPEDERLHMPGETIAAKCSECPQRTGFNSMYQEIREKDACKNRKCFQFKTNVHLRLKRTEIAETFTDPLSLDEAEKLVPLVTERKYVNEKTPFKEKVKTHVEILDKPECRYSVFSLAVEGEKKGQKVFYCEKKEKGEYCDVHNPPPEPPVIDAEYIERRERIINERVREEMRTQIFTKALSPFDDYHPVWMFDDMVQKVIYKLWMNSSLDMRRFITSIIDCNLPKDFMDLSAVRNAIAKMNREQQSRLIFLLVTCETGFLPDRTDELRKIAKDYAHLDYDALEAQIREDLSGSEIPVEV